MRLSKAGNRVKERVGEVKLPLEIYRIYWTWKLASVGTITAATASAAGFSYLASRHANTTTSIVYTYVHIICNMQGRKKALYTFFLSFLTSSPSFFQSRGIL